LRRIFEACWFGNRILAIRLVLSCRQNRLGLSPKIWLVARYAAPARDVQWLPRRLRWHLE